MGKLCHFDHLILFACFLNNLSVFVSDVIDIHVTKLNFSFMFQVV